MNFLFKSYSTKPSSATDTSLADVSTVATGTTTTTTTTTSTTAHDTSPITPSVVAIATPVESIVVVVDVVNDGSVVAEEILEKTEKVDKVDKMEDSPTKQLDLVFVMDCTGSMGSYIEAGKRSIQSIATRLDQEENCDVRFAMIAYRDHPPQDSTFITKTFTFTSDKAKMQTYLDSLSASGGGDGPEAVTAALYAAEHLENWRPNATKIVILIADAPPHGLGEAGDGFPNGDPDGLDPLVIAHSMATKGITIYPVACEPALSQYKNARAFMVGLAEITDGYATSLSSSSLLADIIMGGTAEEVGLQSLAQQYETEMVNIRDDLTRRKGVKASEEEVTNELFNHMKTRNVQTRQWQCDGKIADTRGGYFSKNSKLSEAREEIMKTEGVDDGSVSGGYGIAPSIKSARSRAAKIALPSPFMTKSTFREASTATAYHDYSEVEEKSMDYSVPRYPASVSSATTSHVKTEDVSMEQVQRIFSKAKKQGKI